MNEEQLDFLGRLIDTVDNYMMYSDNPPEKSPFSTGFDPSIRLNAMSNGLQEIRDRLFEFYTLNGGEDVW